MPLGPLSRPDAKFIAASKALEDLIQHDDRAAINALSAFIHAVEAQRDKKIRSRDADVLISETLAVTAVTGQ